MERTQVARPSVDDASELTAVHSAWIRRLVSRLHARHIVPERPAADVREIYRETAASEPELRRVLDEHTHDPELAEPLRREYSMLAHIAGLAPDGTDEETAAQRGYQLVTTLIPVQRLAAS